MRAVHILWNGFHSSDENSSRGVRKFIPNIYAICSDLLLIFLCLCFAQHVFHNMAAEELRARSESYTDVKNSFKSYGTLVPVAH